MAALLPAGYRFYKPLIDAAAAKYGLDPQLVAAICWQESGFNTDAFRHEPNFWNRYLKPKKKWADQNPRRVSSSYGLMQVMYPLVFEDADPSNDSWIPELLFVPENGLSAGCAWLGEMIAWAEAGWPGVAAATRLRAAVASYNGGRGGNAPDAPKLRNDRYAGEVLAKLELIKKAGV